MARILVACEESQRVTTEFRKRGHEAYSCDLQDCSGGHPEWHIKGDVIPLLAEHWDLIIAHPPCTYLSNAGNKYFNEFEYGAYAIKRQHERDEGIKFFMQFVNANCEHIAVENPVGCMSTEYRKPDQIINPYQFGDPYQKRTCLWLKNLPKLKPTNIVEPEPRIQFNSCSQARWYIEAASLPKEERRRVRSKTFPGIAEAFAEQWETAIA